MNQAHEIKLVSKNHNQELTNLVENKREWRRTRQKRMKAEGEKAEVAKK